MLTVTYASQYTGADWVASNGALPLCNLPAFFLQVQPLVKDNRQYLPFGCTAELVVRVTST